MAQHDDTSEKWTIEKKISVTNIFATISAVTAVLVFGSTMSTRVSVMENTLTAFIISQAAVDKRQDEERMEIRRQIREDNRMMNDKLDRILDRTQRK